MFVRIMSGNLDACISISLLANVGSVKLTDFQLIFSDEACLIIPHLRKGIEIKGENCGSVINTYVKKIKDIFSPRVFLASRFCSAIIEKKDLGIYNIELDGRKIDIKDQYIDVSLFSNGVLKISLKLYGSFSEEMIKELCEKSYTLLFNTKVEMNKESFLHDYFAKYSAFEGGKRDLWSLLMSILLYFMEKYLRKELTSSRELRRYLRSDAIDVYFQFVIPEKVVNGSQEIPLYGKYLIKGDTMFTIDKNPSFNNPELYKYFIIFETVTYILSSLKFIVETLLRPLEYYETLDDFVKLIDLITRFSSDVRSITYIKLVSENEEVIEAIKYGYKKMYIENLIQDVNFSLNLLERKLNIISSRADQEAFRIFNALLSVSIAISIGQIMTDLFKADIWFFTEVSIAMWLILFIGFWSLQSYLNNKFYKKILQTLLG